jgi:hypothetical protein
MTRQSLRAARRVEPRASRNRLITAVCYLYRDTIVGPLRVSSIVEKKSAIAVLAVLPCSGEPGAPSEDFLDESLTPRSLLPAPCFGRPANPW